MRTKAKIAIAIDPGILARVDALANAEKRSRSGMIERLLDGAIQDAETFTNVMGNPVVREAMLAAMGRPELFREMLKAAKEDINEKSLEELHGAVYAGFKAAGENVQALKEQKNERTRKQR